MKYDTTLAIVPKFLVIHMTDLSCSILSNQPSIFPFEEQLAFYPRYCQGYCRTGEI